MNGWEYDPEKGWYNKGILAEVAPPTGTPYWYKDKTGKWQMSTYVPGEKGADPVLSKTDMGPISGPPHEDTVYVDGKNIPRDDVTPGSGVPSNSSDPTGKTTGSDAPKNSNTVTPPAAPPATPPSVISSTPKPGYEYIGGGMYAPISKTTGVRAHKPGDESREGATVWNVGEDGIERPEQVVTRDAKGRHANEAGSTPMKPGEIAGWTPVQPPTPAGWSPSQSEPTKEQYNAAQGIVELDPTILGGDPLTRGGQTAWDRMSDTTKGTVSRQLMGTVEDTINAKGAGAGRAQYIQDNMDQFFKDPGQYTVQNGRDSTPNDPVSILGAFYDNLQAGYEAKAAQKAAKAARAADPDYQRLSELRRFGKRPPWASTPTPDTTPENPPTDEEDNQENPSEFSGASARRYAAGTGGVLSRIPAPPSRGMRGSAEDPTPATAQNDTRSRGGNFWEGPSGPAKPVVPVPTPAPTNGGGTVTPPPRPQPTAGAVVDGGWNRPRPPYSPDVPGGTQGQRPNGIPLPSGSDRARLALQRMEAAGAPAPRPQAGAGEVTGPSGPVPTGGSVSTWPSAPRPFNVVPPGEVYTNPSEGVTQPTDPTAGMTPEQKMQYRRDMAAKQAAPRPTGPQRGGSDLPDLYWENPEEYFRQKGNPAPGTPSSGSESQYESQPWFKDWKAAGGTGDPLAWAQANRHWMLGPNGQSAPRPTQTHMGDGTSATPLAGNPAPRPAATGGSYSVMDLQNWNGQGERPVVGLRRGYSTPSTAPAPNTGTGTNPGPQVMIYDDMGIDPTLNWVNGGGNPYDDQWGTRGSYDPATKIALNSPNSLDARTYMQALEDPTMLNWITAAYDRAGRNFHTEGARAMASAPPRPSSASPYVRTG